MRRKARGRKISFIVDEGKTRGLRATVAPPSLASPLFTALECAVENLPAGSVVKIELSAEGGRGAVRFRVAEGGSSDWAGGLAACPVEEIGFEIKDGGTECGICFPCP